MIYFDNSAGSYPKPNELINHAKSVIQNYSFNIGRGGYRASIKTADKIFEVRELIADMFGFKCENVAFTKNCTEALNYAIKGIAEKGCHFVISPFEHNSVTRVLYKMQNEGLISYDCAEYSKDENKFINNFKRLIKENTKALICTHSSNVFGLKMPIEELGKICKDRGITFIVDGAQGAGLCDIKQKIDNIDILCSSGQKSLFGPPGTGFIAIKDGVKLNTLIEGGTGSKSLDLNQPEFFPDRFEAGTLNTVDIILLGYGIKFINETGLENIYNHELSLTQRIYDHLCEDKKIKLYTPYPEKDKSVPILSFNLKDYSSEKTAALAADHDICLRGGYHCSYLAHKSFHTLNTGCVRISPGYFNSIKDCDKFYNVIKKF